MKVDSGQELNKYHRITVWNANATTKAYEMQHEAETIMALQWMNWSDTFFQATTTRCHAGWTGVSKSYWESGLRRSKRLTFGINSEAKCIPQRDSPDFLNVTHIYNNIILVFSATEEEHNITLCQTLQHLKDCRLTLNIAKCAKPKKQKRLDQPQKCAPS